MRSVKCILLSLLAFTITEFSNRYLNLCLGMTTPQTKRSPRKNPYKRVNNGPSGTKQGPNICGGRSLEAYIPFEGPVQVQASLVQVTFYIPCSAEKIVSLEFSLHPFEEDLYEVTPQNISVQNTPGNFNYEFQLPEAGKVYHWYLNLTIVGEEEPMTVHGYVVNTNE